MSTAINRDDFEVKGMPELMRAVEELGIKSTKVATEALKKAAQPILDEAMEHAPERSGRGKSYLRVSRLYKGNANSSDWYVLVGIDRGDISEAFYMKFFEFGASAHTAGGMFEGADIPEIEPRPFLGPAYEKNKSKAVDIIKSEFQKALGIK